MILNSPYISGSLTVTGNITACGGISISGSIASASYAVNASYLNNSGSGEFVPTGSFNAFSSSILTYTGSVNSQLSALQVTSGSNITRLNSIESTTGSLNTASGSAITRLNALEAASGSAITRLSSLESASGSAITRLSSLESKTGSYATTGSNTFVAAQYISQSSNPTGFTTTASLYTDGGLRVTRDAYISGTLYLNNVTVYGTQSIAYISSSQLNIASNLITVNTATPSVQFGGLAVYDSGSSGLTGSILWDSTNNRWIYSNPSGSTYDGGMLISGPRNSSGLGNEVGTTACALMMGQGGDHITSSAITHFASATCFYGTSLISGSGNACFSGQVCAATITSAGTINGTTIYGSTTVCGATICTSGNSYVGGAALVSGCVGIGGVNPSNPLHVYTNVNTCSTAIKIHNGSACAGATIGIEFELLSDYCDYKKAEIRAVAASQYANNIDLAFWSGGSTVNTHAERMRIFSTGETCFACQVCAPSFRGGDSSNTSNGLSALNASTSQATIYSYNYCSAGWSIYSAQGVNYFAGNVGIGNSGPSYKLDISLPTTCTAVVARFNSPSYDEVHISAGLSNYIGTLSTSAFSLRTTNTNRLTIAGTGEACFACQVCSGVGFYASSLQSGITIDSTTNGDTIIASRGLNTALHGIVRTVGQNGTTCMQIISTRSSVDGNLPASVNAVWGLSNHDMVFATSNTERMRISGNNVGIGHSSPSYALDVCNTGASTARLRIIGTTNFALTQAQNSSGVLYMGIDSSTADGFGVGNYSRIIWSSNAYPLVIAVGDAERMRITSTGIATFSCQVCMPATAVISGGGNTLILKKGTGSPAIALAGTSDEAAFLVEGMSGGGMKWYTSPAGCTLSNAAWNAKFNMDVNGISTFSCNICVAKYIHVGTQGGSDIVFLGGGSGVGATIEARYADGNPNVHLAGNGNSWLNRTYGSVGIGTCSPAYLLDVSGATRTGTLLVSNNTTTTWCVGRIDNARTNTWYTIYTWPGIYDGAFALVQLGYEDNNGDGADAHALWMTTGPAYATGFGVSQIGGATNLCLQRSGQSLQALITGVTDRTGGAYLGYTVQTMNVAS